MKVGASGGNRSYFLIYEQCHWHPIHAKRTCMTLYKTSLFVEKGNYLEAV